MRSGVGAFWPRSRRRPLLRFVEVFLEPGLAVVFAEESVLLREDSTGCFFPGEDETEAALSRSTAPRNARYGFRRMAGLLPSRFARRFRPRTIASPRAPLRPRTRSASDRYRRAASP